MIRAKYYCYHNYRDNVNVDIFKNKCFTNLKYFSILKHQSGYNIIFHSHRGYV